MESPTMKHTHPENLVEGVTYQFKYKGDDVQTGEFLYMKAKKFPRSLWLHFEVDGHHKAFRYIPELEFIKV